MNSIFFVEKTTKWWKSLTVPKWVLICSSAENNPKIYSADLPNWPKSLWYCWKKGLSDVHILWRIPSWRTPPDVALEHWMNVQFTNNLGANEGKCVPVSTPPYYFELFMKTLMDAKFVFALCQSRVSYIAPWSQGFLKLHFIVVNLPRFPKIYSKFFFYFSLLVSKSQLFLLI